MIKRPSIYVSFNWFSFLFLLLACNPTFAQSKFGTALIDDDLVSQSITEAYYIRDPERKLTKDQVFNMPLESWDKAVGQISNGPYRGASWIRFTILAQRERGRIYLTAGFPLSNYITFWIGTASNSYFKDRSYGHTGAHVENSKRPVPFISEHALPIYLASGFEKIDVIIKVDNDGFEYIPLKLYSDKAFQERREITKIWHIILYTLISTGGAIALMASLTTKDKTYAKLSLMSFFLVGMLIFHDGIGQFFWTPDQVKLPERVLFMCVLMLCLCFISALGDLLDLSSQVSPLQQLLDVLTLSTFVLCVLLLLIPHTYVIFIGVGYTILACMLALAMLLFATSRMRSEITPGIVFSAILFIVSTSLIFLERLGGYIPPSEFIQNTARVLMGLIVLCFLQSALNRNHRANQHKDRVGKEHSDLLKFNEAYFNEGHNPMFVLEASGVIAELNPSARELIGEDPVDISSLFNSHDDYKRFVCPILKKLKNKEEPLISLEHEGKIISFAASTTLPMKVVVVVIDAPSVLPT